MAIHVLNTLFRSEVKSKIPPKRLRASLFEAAAANRESRESVVASVARSFDLTDDEFEALLFCDLPNEKRIKKPEEELHPGTVALCANSLLIQSFLARALSVRIKLEGNARIVVRQAKLRGLICELSRKSGAGSSELTVSGPFALFRRTFLYGRALGQLLPQLAWCNRFVLKARCIVGERESLLEVSSGDPIFPSKAPKQFDSKIEQKFTRSFLKTFQDWDLIREPEPIESSDTLIFPDFLIREKGNPSNAWFIEIVGFWMPDYLQKKLALLRKAGLRNIILCVDASLNCSDGDIPKDAHVIRFHNSIDLECVRKIITRNDNTLTRKECNDGGRTSHIKSNLGTI